MTHIHTRFHRYSHLTRERREVFVENPNNNPNVQPNNPPQNPPTPEANNTNETPEQRAQRLQEEAADLANKQAEALQKLNDELRQWNDAQRAQKPDHADLQFKDLPEDERARIQNTVMAETGASVSNEGDVKMSKDTIEVHMNKFAGTVGKIMAPMMKMLEKLKPFLKYLGYDTADTEKNSKASPQEDSRVRVEELLKNQPDRQKVEADLVRNRDTANAAKTKAENDKTALEADVRSKETAITAKQNAILNNNDPKAIEAAEKQIAILKTQIDTLKTQIADKQKEIDKQKGIYDEAVQDLKTLFEINKQERIKDESEKVASIKDDGQWHPASEVKNSKEGWEYRIGPDKRAYTREVAPNVGIKVIKADKTGWVDVDVDAGIADPELKPIYRALVKMMDGKNWYTISNEDPHFYCVNFKEKTLIRQDAAKKVEQYDAATKTWKDIGAYDPAAAG